ncbi:hypothetical protein [Tessaracoccus aquimaris]|uniref:hypothetical protein n=1 Tax=Tessaracoccus aquimaris TaxID=1332264 RepID=UPI0011AB72DB|nr:hypothetical protein [Tessaracoccus aquimaris]
MRSWVAGIENLDDSVIERVVAEPETIPSRQRDAVEDAGRVIAEDVLDRRYFDQVIGGARRKFSQVNCREGSLGRRDQAGQCPTQPVWWSH